MCLCAGLAVAAAASGTAVAAPLEVARTATLGQPAFNSAVQLSANGAVFLAHPRDFEVFRAVAGSAAKRITRIGDLTFSGDGMGDGVSTTAVTNFAASDAWSIVGVHSVIGGYRGTIDSINTSVMAFPLVGSSSPARLPACASQPQYGDVTLALDGDLVAYLDCQTPRSVAVQDLRAAGSSPSVILRPDAGQRITKVALGGHVLAYQEVAATGEPSAAGSQTVVYDLSGGRELYRVVGGATGEIAVEANATLLRVGAGCAASVFTQAQPAGRALPLPLCHLVGMGRERVVYRDGADRVLWSDLGAPAPHELAAAASGASSDGDRFALALAGCAQYRILTGTLADTIPDSGHPSCPLSLGGRARLRRGAIEVPVRCPAGCQVAVDLLLPLARRARAPRPARDLALGHRSAVILPGARAAVRVPLNWRALRTLRRLHAHRVQVVLSPHNPAGSPRALKRTVALGG
ncbi:MAG: hypothetical protein NVS2B6_13980 [Thermoleophilaceae bacterium]